jgi:hypothetical protein
MSCHLTLRLSDMVNCLAVVGDVLKARPYLKRSSMSLNATKEARSGRSLTRNQATLSHVEHKEFL